MATIAVRDIFKVPLHTLRDEACFKVPAGVSLAAAGTQKIALEVDVLRDGRLTPVRHVLIGADNPATYVQRVDDGVICRLTTNVKEEVGVHNAAELPATITATVLESGRAVARGSITCVVTAKTATAQRATLPADPSEPSSIAQSPLPRAPRKRRRVSSCDRRDRIAKKLHLSQGRVADDLS